MEKLGVIAILVKDESQVKKPERAIQVYGLLVETRLELKLTKHYPNFGFNLKTLNVVGTKEELEEFEVELNQLNGIEAKLTIIA